MSIEIVYDRRFIRTNRGIIPLLLAGSSNCFEEKIDRCGRPYEVAERRWTYFFSRDTLEMPEEQHMPTRISGPVIARFGRNGQSYVCSYEKGKNLHFSPDIQEAIVFNSVDEAYELMGNGWGKLYFVKAATPAKVKPYVIRLDGGRYSGNYVAKKSASRLFTTGVCMAAMRFGTPAKLYGMRKS